jgi:hypothetical protein
MLLIADFTIYDIIWNPVSLESTIYAFSTINFFIEGAVFNLFNLVIWFLRVLWTRSIHHTFVHPAIGIDRLRSTKLSWWFVVFKRTKSGGVDFDPASWPIPKASFNSILALAGRHGKH